MPSSLRIRPFAALAAVLLAVACNRSQKDHAAESRPAFQAAANAAKSNADSAADTGMAARKPARGALLGTDSVVGIQALLDTVEARLLRGDTAGLVRLMLDDSAWRRHIYPASAGYDPASVDAFNFLLGMHKANSAKALCRVLADVRNPDSTPAVLLRALDSVPAPGGMLYEVRPGEGVRPFGTAFCSGGACRVATFGRPGAPRRKD